MTLMDDIRRDSDRADETAAQLDELTARRQGGTAPDHGVIHRRVSDIRMEPIRWLWPGRIARGKVSIIAGHPGLGKSQLTASLAAIITSGGRWPVDRTAAPVGRVVILSAEDDPADTIGPRLTAAGADTSQVHVIDAVGDLDDDGRLVRRTPDLVRHLDRLDALITELGDVALLVVDPVTAYLGGIDSHRTSDVRGALAPLSEMAARHGTAVVAVSHLRKAGGAEALMRVTGSLAFVAAARAAYIVARDPEDDDRRLVLPAKNNLGDDRHGLAYRIESATVGDGIETSRVSWEAEAVTITADQALESPGDDTEERSATDEAMDFLHDLLAEGPVKASDAQKQAREAGIGDKALRRARERLGIRPQKAAFKGGWWWSLRQGEPEGAPQDAQDAQAHDGGTLDTFGASSHDGEEAEL